MSEPTPLETIFFAALAKAPAERVAYLNEACAGNDNLRHRVERMLAAQAEAGNFLESPPSAVVADIGPTLDQPTSERPSTQIGPYKLRQQIGEGGMGAVYLAEQKDPVERQVALKIIKPGMDTRQVIARFEAERQALALMDHPNIAKVLDAGTTESGRPYFVMELVKGQPITQYCDEKHLTPRQRLELLLPVCQAIQHAHQKGIIHRDIKPTNILVAEYDEKPVPKVIDFGVAKAVGSPLTEKTMFTGFGQLVGTLEYMSPEQARVNQLDIDTRSDIYSLGVLLYELLTGSTPFDKQRLRSAAWDEMLRIIREEEPEKPSTRLSELSSPHAPREEPGGHASRSETATLASIAAVRSTEPARLTKLVRGELDWIVMKALEKDRSRRYETASALAADVQHYLSDEPVVACPPSAAYRLRKFVRRNKRSLATALLLGIMLLAALGGVAGTIGWAIRNSAALQEELADQRRVRQSALEEKIASALAESTAAYDKDQIPEALTALRQAEGMLASGDKDTSIGQRTSQWRSDLEFVTRLEQIPLARANPTEKNQMDYAGSDASYQAAFRQYGLDLHALPADEAAKRIRNSPIKRSLVAALDDWVWIMRRERLADREKLLAVLDQADADPWRKQLRQAMEKKDSQSLRKLAADARLLDQPPATMYLLGLGLQRTDDPLAIEVMKQAQRRNPGDFWINLSLGTHLPPVEAVGYLRVAALLRPQDAQVKTILGWALAATNQHAEAVNLYEEAIQLKPDDYFPHYNLGNSWTAQGRPADAERCFREAIRLNPTYVRAYLNLASSLANRKEYPAAETECRKALELNPREPMAHLWLGNLLQRDDQRLAEAESSYREACRLAPQLDSPHLGLGLCLSRQGKLDEAEAEFRLALQMAPKTSANSNGLANAFFQQSDALMKQAKWTEAEAKLQEAVRLSPSTSLYHDRLGSVLKQQNRTAEAEAAFREAIRHKPEEATFHQHLLRCLDRQPDHNARREAAARDAVRLVPNNGQLRYELANVLATRGSVAQAIEEFREAIRLQPMWSGHHRGLAGALVRLRQWDEARAEFERTRELGPDDYYLACMLATLHLHAGDTEGYRRECQRLDAHLARIDIPGAADFMARCCLLHKDGNSDAERLERALTVLVARAEQDPTYGYYFATKALAEYRQGRCAQAVPFVERAALRDRGGNTDALAFAVLALVQHGLDQPDKARAALTSAQEIVAKLSQPESGQPLAPDWTMFLHAQILCREAEAALGKTPEK